MGMHNTSIIIAILRTEVWNPKVKSMIAKIVRLNIGKKEGGKGRKKVSRKKQKEGGKEGRRKEERKERGRVEERIF